MIYKRINMNFLEFLDNLWKLSIIDLKLKNEMRIKCELITKNDEYINYINQLYKSKKITWYLYTIFLDLKFL